jgi:hypothetical protein
MHTPVFQGPSLLFLPLVHCISSHLGIAHGLTRCNDRHCWWWVCSGGSCSERHVCGIAVDSVRNGAALRVCVCVSMVSFFDAATTTTARQARAAAPAFHYAAQPHHYNLTALLYSYTLLIPPHEPHSGLQARAAVPGVPYQRGKRNVLCNVLGHVQRRRGMVIVFDDVFDGRVLMMVGFGRRCVLEYAIGSHACLQSSDFAVNHGIVSLTIHPGTHH